MSGTNGAPAANSGGNNNNRGPVAFTTPVRPRKTKGGVGTSGVSQPSHFTPSSSGGNTSSGTGTIQPPDSDPGDNLDLADLPFEQSGTRPLMKPASMVGGAVWDGTTTHGEGQDRLGVALAAMLFWKRLAKVVKGHKWTEDYTWLYVTSFGTTGTLASDVHERCKDMGELKLYLERRFLRDITVAELTAPVYRVAQKGISIVDYAAEGSRIWRMVGDLIPSQEKNAIQFWVSQLDQRWAQRNQVVFSVLKTRCSWEEVEDAIAEFRHSIWDEAPMQVGRGNHTPGGGSSPKAPVQVSTGMGTSLTPSAGKPGSRANKNGPGCWSCGSMEHLRRDCPQSAKVEKVPGKVTGRGE